MDRSYVLLMAYWNLLVPATDMRCRSLLVPADARGYMLSDRGFFSFLVKIFVYIYICVCVCIHTRA